MATAHRRPWGFAARDGGSLLEWVLVPIFCFGCLMRGADFVAVQAGSLEYLSGHLPFWIQNLPFLAIAITLAVWLLLRRRIGAWAALLGYILALPILIAAATHTIDSRVDHIDRGTWLSTDERSQLEATTGVRVVQRQSSGKPIQLQFLRDAAVRRKIELWLDER